MDMTYLQNEINKHKININNLSTNLFNSFDVNEEISIASQLKNETELLISLLNIKKNSMLNISNNMNNFNFFNPWINPINMDINLFQQQQNHEERLKEEEKNQIQVTFDDVDDKGYPQKISVICKLDDKISDITEKFIKKAEIFQ